MPRDWVFGMPRDHTDARRDLRRGIASGGTITGP